MGKYQTECDAYLHKLRSLSPPELAQKALLDFLGDVIPRLDPTSRNQVAEAHRGLWAGVVELAQLGGVELIYPGQGTAYDSSVHDIAGVDDGASQASNTITSISRFGYRVAGSVSLKASVKVAR